MINVYQQDSTRSESTFHLKGVLQGFLQVLLVVFAGSTAAQDWKRTQNWYFGDSAGLSFATNPPTALTDGSIYSEEANTSFSDINGNLILYTDGTTIRGSNHSIIENGHGISGNKSSSHGVLFVPLPNSDSVVYLFYTSAQGQGGLYYSTIVRKANGAFRVENKNTYLLGTSCEAIAATYHNNGKWIWVVVHEYGNSCFNAYLLKENGIVGCPTLSCTGQPLKDNFLLAQNIMKISHNGRYLANSLFNTASAGGKVEIFLFDDLNGKVEIKKILSGMNLVTGLEFSSSDSFLYIIEREKYIKQYDLLTEMEEVVHTHIGRIYGAILSSLDGKIYGCKYNNDTMFVIHNPNQKGVNCNVEASSFILSSGRALGGLPNFVSSYKKKWPIQLVYSYSCEDNNYHFDKISDTLYDYYKWIIKDESENIETEFFSDSFTYKFPDFGWYTIHLIGVSGSRNDSVSKRLYVFNRVNLKMENVECADSVVLDAGQGHCYLWSDGSMDRYLKVKQSGTYGVRIITDHFCTVYDTVVVTLDKHPVTVPISRDGDTLKSAIGFKKYQWYRDDQVLQNDTLSSLKLTQRGTYKVRAVDGGNCSDFSELLVVDTLTSFFEILPERSIYIYPNPSRAEAGVFVKSGEPLEQVVLYSVEGRVIRQAQPHTTEWHTGELPKGVYLIVINQMYHQKIIIH